MNLARAVRISGDGGQEGRHLAKKKRVTGLGISLAVRMSEHFHFEVEVVANVERLEEVPAGYGLALKGVFSHHIVY